MKIALELNHPQHVEMFDSFAGMVRAMGQLVANRTPGALEELDRRLDTGAVVQVSLTVGSAGPLGVLFQGVQPDGSVFDLVTIDAPPSAERFRFGR
jgi:hypothetical protein